MYIIVQSVKDLKYFKISFVCACTVGHGLKSSTFSNQRIFRHLRIRKKFVFCDSFVWESVHFGTIHNTEISLFSSALNWSSRMQNFFGLNLFQLQQI